MPRKPAPKKDPNAKRMLSWRESDDVIQTAISIAEAEDSNKQMTFSALFRNGIALHDLQEEVRAYLKEQRMGEVAKLEQSKDKWLRREAKSRRTMLTLYEPTDGEVIDFIRTAAKGRMYGKVQREASDKEADLTASFPEETDVKEGNPPIDEHTVVVKIGAGVIGDGDMNTISAILRGVRDDGSAWLANFWDGTYQKATLIPSSEMMDDGDSRISFQGDLSFSILFSDSRLACSKSLLDGRTGEYGTSTVTHDYLGVSRPQAFVIEWLDGAIRMDADGVACYRLPALCDVEPNQFVVRYEGYTIVYEQGHEDLQVLHG